MRSWRAYRRECCAVKAAFGLPHRWPEALRLPHPHCSSLLAGLPCADYLLVPRRVGPLGLLECGTVGPILRSSHRIDLPRPTSVCSHIATARGEPQGFPRLLLYISGLTIPRQPRQASSGQFGMPGQARRPRAVAVELRNPGVGSEPLTVAVIATRLAGRRPLLAARDA